MYRVDWLQASLDQLTEIWMQSDAHVRQAITAATHKIDKTLAYDPANIGESRPGGRRIEFIAPLSIIFEVDDANAAVTILHVRLFGKRKK